MAAAVAHFTTMAQTFADAFEPDLESWETLPVALTTEHHRVGLYQQA